MGYSPKLTEPNFLTQLFSEEGFEGVRYWQIINLIGIAIVVIELLQYLTNNKRLGGKPSAATIAIFGLIVLLLTSFTIPDMVKSLQKRVVSQ